MTDDEFFRLGIKLSTLWPERFTEHVLDECRTVIDDLPIELLYAAIDEHHRTAHGAPTAGQIRHEVERQNSLVRQRLLNRTSQYLHALNADGKRAEAEINAIRHRLDRLPQIQRADLLERALAKLAEEMPSLAGHFRDKGEGSTVVQATMVALLNHPHRSELSA